MATMARGFGPLALALVLGTGGCSALLDTDSLKGGKLDTARDTSPDRRKIDARIDRPAQPELRVDRGKDLQPDKVSPPDKAVGLEGKAPDKAVGLEGKAPDKAVTPEAKVPDKTITPEAKAPDASKPEGPKPEGPKPEGPKPEGPKPDAPLTQ